MSNFFNPDNKFFSIMSKLWDMVVLSLIWVICCIPIITIGPASTAMYYAMVKVIRRERGYVLAEFWRSFKLNFKQGAIYSVIFALLAYIMYIDYQYAYALALEGSKYGTAMFFGFLIITFLLVSIFLYLFPVLSRFNLKFTTLLRNSFYMTVRHFLTTLYLVILFLAAIVGVLYMPPLIFIIPGMYTLLASFGIEKIFKRYMLMPQPTPEQEEEEADRDTVAAENGEEPADNGQTEPEKPKKDERIVVDLDEEGRKPWYLE